MYTSKRFIDETMDKKNGDLKDNLEKSKGGAVLEPKLDAVISLKQMDNKLNDVNEKSKRNSESIKRKTMDVNKG